MHSGYRHFSDLRSKRLGISGLDGGIAGIAAPFLYVPDLAPVGHASTYFPRSVSEDARALNFTGFLDDASLASLFPSTGNQADDIDQTAGAWDADFRAAVTRFQAAKGLTVDSWIGPQTRTALAVAVAARNAQGVPSFPVPSLPPAIIPVNPGGVPAKPAVLPGITPGVPAGKKDETTTYVALGVGALALGALGYFFLKKKK
jgi:LPXTG-motif cell wall-anchored protein